MNGQEAGSEKSGESKEGEQTEGQEKLASVEQAEEPGTHYAEILLFCHPRNVGNLVRSFEDEIKHAAGELPMCVLWSGVSGLLHQGVIILEWERKVTPAFLHNLSIDQEIFDFVVSEWIRNDDAQQSASEQEELINQAPEDDQVDGKRFV